MDEPKQSGFDKYKENIKSLKRSFVSSYVRGGSPTSDRSRAALVVNNFFLHVQGAKTHLNTLRPTYTFGLGLISLYLFLITTVSGVLLMLYYIPSAEGAYNSVKDINYVVFGGRLLRNIHKWAGEGMIIFVMLHMARVFYTSSYKEGREFNWVIGMVLLSLTFVLNYTGYLLPWDQLAYWALVIGANIAQSPKEITDILGVTGFFDIGGFQKELLLGGGSTQWRDTHKGLFPPHHASSSHPVHISWRAFLEDKKRWGNNSVGDVQTKEEGRRSPLHSGNKWRNLCCREDLWPYDDCPRKDSGS